MGPDIQIDQLPPVYGNGFVVTIAAGIFSSGPQVIRNDTGTNAAKSIFTVVMNQVPDSSDYMGLMGPERFVEGAVLKSGYEFGIG